MRVLMFYQSLLSDWNHGNAHFLRGVATELLRRGHAVEVFEPADSWSLRNLLSEHGRKPLRKFHATYPQLSSCFYDLATVDLPKLLEGADLVIVHEWNDPELVRRIGELRREGSFRLLFHDTHHRMVTAPESMAKYDLTHYDGVLAYGQILQELYRASGRVQRAWVWHEAADLRVFHPVSSEKKQGDVVWVGNWGDGERTAELQTYLVEPIRALGLRSRVHGVRFPEEARHSLAEAGIEYAGWLPNFEVPQVFSRFRVTVHIPRRPYAEQLPGIPTIRVFEALACGIPLVCSYWEDCEELFREGDFLVARNGQEMVWHLKNILEDASAAQQLAKRGLETVVQRHTCAHRVDQLLAIVRGLKGPRDTTEHPFAGEPLSADGGRI